VTTTEKAAFVPNCVFIPASAIWKDNRGEHVDAEDAVLLMLDGNNNYGEVFTKEHWENDGEPNYLRRFGRFVNADDTPIDPELGRVELMPDLCVIKIDEREWWLDPLVLEQTKQIFGVYVFDRRQHFHLCSFSASYELHFLGSQWEVVEGLSDEDHEELWERITEGDRQSEPITYWDRYDIDAMMQTECREGFLPPDATTRGGFILTGIKSITTEDAIEEAQEAYAASEF
jgi:hypothetical protein